MELNKRNMKRIMLLIAFGITFYLCLKNISHVSEITNAVIMIFQPLLLGAALAFILNVLMRQVETVLFAHLNKRFKKRWPKVRRPISILITMLIVIGIIALIAFIFVPEIIITITNLTKNIPPFFANLQDNISAIKKNNPVIGNYINTVNINWSSISNMVVKYGQQVASSLVGSTVMLATGIVRAIFSVILGVIFAINILMQKEKLISQIQRIIYAYIPHNKADKFVRVCSLTNHAFSNFIAGQCTEACILGTLCFIGMSIFRFPFALLISVLVAFMALIPIFGSLISVSVGALLILVISPLQAFWFVVFFIILQQIEGNFIYPRVVGSKVGLPALWVLIAITIGGNAFGIVGMIINIPLCSVLYTMLREDVTRRHEKKELKGETAHFN